MNKTLLAAAALFWVTTAVAQDAPAPGAPPVPPEQVKPELDVSKMRFSPDSIRQVVNHHNDRIQACYEDLLANRKQTPEGRVMTSFVITPEGLVKGAKVLKKGTTLNNGKLHDCVVAAVTAMTFPKPNDRRDHPIEYPFNLKAIK